MSCGAFVMQFHPKKAMRIGGSALEHCPQSRDTPLMVNHLSYKWDAEEALGKRSIGVNLSRPFYARLFIFYVQ